MTSSLSFHCMICFDEFDTHTIYPVVLPCGHTYVCILCANRIDKCMECRAPLLTDTLCIATDESHTNNRNSNAHPHAIQPWHSPRSRRPENNFSFAAARSGRRPSAYSSNGNMITARSLDAPPTLSPPPSPTKKTRVPLPKNLVLMSLIEASQLAKESAQNQLIAKGLRQYSLEDCERGERDVLDEEEGRIILGSDMATSACGTYAVAAKGGLKILANAITTARGHENDSWKRNVEEIVVNNGKKMVKIHTNHHNNHDELSSDDESSGALFLNYGDRIQVVSVVGKWAKLARGYGYVYCENSSDLVKVGGVLDKAANIEAMIYSLSYCRNKLLEAKVSTERDAITLMSELETLLMQEEDVTVIGAEAFDSNNSNSSDIGHEAMDEIREEFSTSFSLNEHSGRYALYHADHEGADADENGDRRDDNNNDNRKDTSLSLQKISQVQNSRISFLDYAICGIRSMGMVSGDVEDDRDQQELVDTRDSTRQYSSNAMVRAAQEWRRRNGKEASQNSHIDFRTGMSGHQGVLSHHAQEHSHEVLGRGYNLPRMSDHCGLTPKRARTRRSIEGSHSLSFGE